MNNHLRMLIRSERQRQGLSFGDLSRRLGYRNVSKGANRIAVFEERGFVHKDVLKRLIETLGIAPNAINDAIDRDHRDFDEWLDEPVLMELYLVYSPTVGVRRPLPQEIETWDEAECYARQIAREKKQKVLLVLNRRTSLMFSSEGELIGRRTSGAPPDPRHPL